MCLHCNSCNHQRITEHDIRGAYKLKLILYDAYYVLFHLGVYCYSKNHPVVRVEILGYIVSVDEREKLTSYGGDTLCCNLLFKRCYAFGQKLSLLSSSIQ